jgi:Abortive infection C-terminus
MGQFWAHVKQWSTYAERREVLWEAFAPLLEAAELGGSPSDDATTDVLEALEVDHVVYVWRKALNRRADDPEGAITSARTLLESVCKLILDDYGVPYSDDDLPKLYGKVAKEMRLSPSAQTEEAFKQILGGCYSVVMGLGTLRNRLSDPHGQGALPVRPAARHAELAVNLAGAMASFLVETWEARRREGANEPAS